MSTPTKFCPNCGEASLAGASFCAKCGSTISSLTLHSVNHQPNNHVALKEWTVSVFDFAQTTHDSWRSGALNIIDVRYAEIAAQEDGFLGTVIGLMDILGDRLPFFKGEYWIGGTNRDSWRLTSYRFFVKDTKGKPRLIPLNEITNYKVMNSFIVGTRIDLTGTFGTLQIPVKTFPKEGVFEFALRSQAWKLLPPEIQARLGASSL